jgi:hypothetical protein
MGVQSERQSDLNKAIGVKKKWDAEKRSKKMVYNVENKGLLRFLIKKHIYVSGVSEPLLRKKNAGTHMEIKHPKKSCQV